MKQRAESEPEQNCYFWFKLICWWFWGGQYRTRVNLRGWTVADGFCSRIHESPKGRFSILFVQKAKTNQLLWNEYYSWKWILLLKKQCGIELGSSPQRKRGQCHLLYIGASLMLPVFWFYICFLLQNTVCFHRPERGAAKYCFQVYFLHFHTHTQPRTNWTNIHITQSHVQMSHTEISKPHLHLTAGKA